MKSQSLEETIRACVSLNAIPGGEQMDSVNDVQPEMLMFLLIDQFF